MPRRAPRRKHESARAAMPRKLYAFDFDDNIAATDACIRTF